MVKHYTAFTRPPKNKEWQGLAEGEEDLVVRAGYRSTAQQVEEYVRAGIQLDEWRKMVYDIPPGDNSQSGEIEIDDVPIDPTRMPSYNEFDAHNDLIITLGRLQAQQRKAKIEAERDEPLPEPSEPVASPEEPPA